MNYNSIKTAQEILNAFHLCEEDTELQLELFEKLATRHSPPIQELFDLFKIIKLELLLALIIQ